jgi:polar amino acid transport system substrate-binding protein
MTDSGSMTRLGVSLQLTIRERGRRWIGALALALAWCLSAPAGAASQIEEPPLTLMMERSPPVNFRNPDGHFAGITVDILNEAALRATVAIAIEQLPWRRAYRTALSRPNACVFGTARLEEREALFRWIGPLTRGGVVLYGHADRIYGVRSIEDVARKGYSVSVEQDDITHLAMLRYPNLNLDVADEVLGLRKLKAHRVDLWAGGTLSGLYTARLEGIYDLVPILPILSVDVMLACNLKSHVEPLARLQAAISAMRAEGKVAEIERRYLGTER